jgi:hypothetical protein
MSWLDNTIDPDGWKKKAETYRAAIEPVLQAGLPMKNGRGKKGMGHLLKIHLIKIILPFTSKLCKISPIGLYLK